MKYRPEEKPMIELVREAQRTGKPIFIDSLESIASEFKLLCEYAIKHKVRFVSKKKEETELCEMFSEALYEVAQEKTLMARPKSSKKQIKLLRNRRIKMANEFANRMKPILKNIEEEIEQKDKKPATMQRISEKLNSKNIHTYQGKGEWFPGTVWHLKKRIARLELEKDKI